MIVPPPCSHIFFSFSWVSLSRGESASDTNFVFSFVNTMAGGGTQVFNLVKLYLVLMRPNNRVKASDLFQQLRMQPEIKKKA